MLCWPASGWSTHAQVHFPAAGGVRMPSVLQQRALPVVLLQVSFLHKAVQTYVIAD